MHASEGNAGFEDAREAVAIQYFRAGMVRGRLPTPRTPFARDSNSVTLWADDVAPGAAVAGAAVPLAFSEADLKAHSTLDFEEHLHDERDEL